MFGPLWGQNFQLLQKAGGLWPPNGGPLPPLDKYKYIYSTNTNIYRVQVQIHQPRTNSLPGVDIPQICTFYAPSDIFGGVIFAPHAKCNFCLYLRSQSYERAILFKKPVLWESHFIAYIPKISSLTKKMDKCCNNFDSTLLHALFI